MKLSEVKGKRTFDVIADVIEPVCNIAEDREAAALFRREKAPEGVEPRAFLLSRLKKSVPKLLKGHKTDAIAILAAIEGVTPEEYAGGLNLIKLTEDFIDLITDKAFIELFISAQSGTGSGSARESTGGKKA